MIPEDEQLLASRFSTIKEIEDLPKGKVRSKELVKESLVIRGVQQTVHRYYVTYAGGFRGVGWIIDSEINFCMICNSEFGYFLRKHHCRSCGNILCHSCCANFVIIEEMYELGEQRVCNMCYWGQSPVYASNTRKNDDDTDMELEDEDFIIASKINASINASIRTFHFEINKHPEYCGEIILEQGCDWKTITKCLFRDLNIYNDLYVALNNNSNNNNNHNNNNDDGSGNTSLDDNSINNNDYEKTHNEEIQQKIRELLQQISIRYFVLVDGDNEPLSPNLDNSRLFWQFVSHYSVIQKTFFMIHLSKGSHNVMELARRGKLIKQEIQKTEI